jgi:hypothetical protein
MSENVPLSAREVAGIIQRTINAHWSLDTAEAPDGVSFELTAPSTGQRFRVTVAGVPAGEAVDAALSRLTAAGEG